ncbi:serine protease, partial [Streptomyces sp. ISL-44]|nr:serine protease [Streptomyces sp. ISL-44]
MAELVTICDLAGQARGSGFVADDRGTVVTSHEAVEGLSRVVLHAPGPAGRTWLAEAGDVTALPGLALALVRTDGLGMRPLPVAVREAIAPGTYVRLPARGWRQARVLGGAEVTYPTAGGLHAVPARAAMELAIGTDGRDALSLGGEACGGPVLDAETGAVLAVLGTALRAEHRSGGFAVALRAAAVADPAGPLAALLERNTATVPAYGPDLNLAGILELTGTTVGAAFPPDEAEPGFDPVERPGTAAELEAFTAGDRLVLGLVGEPGTGRTTALAALAVRRARGSRPAPTLWLHGADLTAGDTSLADAVTRALAAAARIVTAGGPAEPGDPPAAEADAEQVARVAGEAGRALLVVLDAPEEMPPELAHRLGPWTEATVGWLRAAGARLAVAARPEHWERAGALCPPEVLHTPARPARRMPPALPLGDLTAAEAETARARLGIPEGAVREADARHPLTLRLLAGIRAAEVTAGRPGRDEVFAAHLDLLCLRAAVRVAADQAGGAR